jgi:hypothetical protein
VDRSFFARPSACLEDEYKFVIVICLVINGVEIIGEYYQASHHRDRMPIFDDETRNGDLGRAEPRPGRGAMCKVRGAMKKACYYFLCYHLKCQREKC